MALRYILKQLVMPPSILLIILAGAWFARKRFPRTAALSFISALLALWLMSLPVVVELNAKWLEQEASLEQAQWPDLAERADVIVILGASRTPADPGWGEEQPSHLAIERMRYAARIAKASGLPLLTTGGLHFGQGSSEAQLMADVLAQDFGLPTRWREHASRTTWENAVLSAELLKDEDLKRVVLVTQAAHMPRARWCFEQAGFEVISAPMGHLSVSNRRPLGGWLPEAKAIAQNSALLNEWLGLWLYPLRYHPASR